MGERPESKWEQVEAALTSRFEVRAGMKPPPSIGRALQALASLRAENEEMREVCRFLARPDYDWVEDWEEAQDMAGRALRDVEAE